MSVESEVSALAARLADEFNTVRDEVAAALAVTAVVVQWDGESWGTYDTDPDRVRDFRSQDDPEATAPTYYNPRDSWLAYPGVLEED